MSLEKLKNLLKTHGYLPVKYFYVKDSCHLVEIISVKTAKMIMISIPTRLSFNVVGLPNSYKLKSLHVDDSSQTIENEFTGEQDESNIEQMYTQSHDEMSKIDIQTDATMESLIDLYKRPIHLNDLSKEDALDVKDIFRQLKRLKYCMNEVRYTLVILYKTYVCILREDNNIECYYIKGVKPIETRKFYITADMDLFYEKVTHIDADVDQITTGIKNILDKNHSSQFRLVNTMFQTKTNLVKQSNDLFDKKNLYTRYIKELELLLDRIVAEEKKLIEKKMDLSKVRTSFSNDYEHVEHKTLIEKSLENINKIKDDIVQTIIDVRNKRDHLTLVVDKVLFDNALMLSTIFKNFELLTNLC